MFKTTWNLIVPLLCLLLWQGCDFSDTPSKDFNVYRLKEKCSLNTEAFSKILEQDITTDIDCLESNFNQYMAGVISGDSSGLRQDHIASFVREYFDGDTENMVKSLNILFSLNMVLLNDTECRISKQNIAPIFQILRTSNRYLVRLKQLYDQLDDSNAVSSREEINKTLTDYLNSLLAIAGGRSEGPNHLLDINSFIRQVLDNMTEDSYDGIIFTITPILKYALLGGDANFINYQEVITLINKVPKVLMTFFDGFYLKEKHFKNANDFYQTQLIAAKHFPSLLNHATRGDQTLITHNQIMDLAAQIKSNQTDNKLDVDLLDKVLQTIKPIVTGGKFEIYTKDEILKLLAHLTDFLEIRLFNSITYDHYQEVLSANKPIQGIAALPAGHYPEIRNSNLEPLHQIFNLILKQYRFFKKEGGLQYYIHEYKRNKSSVLEISYYRWALGIIGKPYSTSNQEILISMQTLEQLLWDFKPLLEKYELWSTFPETFARNTILLGDLFQYQSDGNLLLNVDEASEYFILVVNAVTVKDQVTKELTQRCDYGPNLDKPEFHVNCFRANLTDILFKKLGYQEYMPRLFDYLKTAGETIFKDYLYKVEYFARDIPDDNIPIGARDMTLILGALLNIESTFIRFDTNRDNIINPSELSPPAYNVYKQAIVDLVHQQDPDTNVSGYEKSIFLYLVKNMEIPTKPALVWFHYAPGREQRYTFDSHRANIGAILYNLIKMSKAKLIKKLKK